MLVSRHKLASPNLTLRRADFVHHLLHPEFHRLVQDHEQKLVVFLGLRLLGAQKYRYNSADASDQIGMTNGLAVTIFGGDLLPWRERAGVGPPELAAPGSRPEPFRFAVLGELGRSGAIGRFLNRDTAGVRGRLGLASIDYEDVPLATRDSLEAAGAGGTTIPLFALRCPALCVSSRADDLRELGADAFANLLECLPAGRRP